MHPFIPSIGANTCQKCKRPEISHTELATCEACPNIGPCEIWLGMLLCKSCYEKEEKQIKSIVEAKAIDDRVQLRSDVFNAETVAIVQLKQLIDADDSITNNCED